MAQTSTFSTDEIDIISIVTDKLQLHGSWSKDNSSRFGLQLQVLDTGENSYIEFTKDKSHIDFNRPNLEGWQSTIIDCDWADGDLEDIKYTYHFSGYYYEAPTKTLANSTFDYGFIGVNTTHVDPENIIYAYKLIKDKPLEISVVNFSSKTLERVEKTRLDEYLANEFNQHINDLCFQVDFQKIALSNLSLGIENIAIMCDAILSNNVDFYTAQEIYSRLRA